MKKKLFHNWPCIAHRGLHNTNIPENSIKAFQNAIINHYAIELDVHLTKDNQVVVFHDDNLNRMTNKNMIIKNSTYLEIKFIKLLNSNETIPLLSDVLSLINGQVPVLIELKYDQKPGRLEKEVAKIIQNYSGICYFQSFRLSSLWHIKRRTKKKVGLLIHKQSKAWFIKPIFFYLFQIDFISYPISRCPNPTIEKIYRKIPVLLWTIKHNTKKVPSYSDQIIFENKPCEIKKNII